VLNKYISRCQRGLSRENKLYEGHRMMLPEHKEKVIETKRREYAHLTEQTIVQDDEEKERIVSIAIKKDCEVEVCWRETINPIKLDSEQYANYLHKVFDPNVEREVEVRTQKGTISGVITARAMIRCKFDSRNKLIALTDLLSVRLLEIDC
jgi:hypothetical protein